MVAFTILMIYCAIFSLMGRHGSSLIYFIWPLITGRKNLIWEDLINSILIKPFGDSFSRRPMSCGDVSKPSCRYGDKCYRKNPDHLKQYSHPAIRVSALTSAAMSSDTVCSTKKQKTEKGSASASHSSGICWPSTYSLFLSQVHHRAFPAKFNSPVCAADITDILRWNHSKLVGSAQFDYMIDVEWLMEQYPEDTRKKPLLLVCGDKFLAYPKKRENITVARAHLPIQFGTHHTKMMLLRYTDGVRVVIHTANLIPEDWGDKTQSIFWSPLFPFRKTDDKSDVIDDEATQKFLFKSDLIEYLKFYFLKQLDPWIDLLSCCDMSTAKVRLIGSVPGRHTGVNISKFGHLKLSEVLKYLTDSPMKPDWPLVCQFSSIGSLGPAPENWLLGEFGDSLFTAAATSGKQKKKDVRLIFPNVENVRTSFEGYAAGGSIPYQENVAKKQPYLRNYMHQWIAEKTGRTRAAPHIKSFLRMEPNSSRLGWILFTSSNLSKAAWGSYEKNRSQLMIRSYELGVLYLPEDYGFDSFSTDLEASNYFPVPYDLPPTPYSATDEPWIADIPYKKPDCNNEKWLC